MPVTGTHRSLISFARRGIAAAAVLMAATFVAVPWAQAQDDPARKILRSMAGFLGGQKAFTVEFNSSIEVITPDLQKIQFNSSGRLALSRPDKLHAMRSGGYSDVEMMFDGKTFTVHDRAGAVFAQTDFSGSIDKLVDKLRNELGVEAPGADLMLSGIYDALIDDVMDAKYIGHAVIDGVECEHLAFRNAETDWQIWIEIGQRPLPRKYVITSKTVTAAPQYTLVLKSWKTDPQLGPDAFIFKPPATAKKVDFQALPHLDELPVGTVQGGKK
jgi:hypothetical protein